MSQTLRWYIILTRGGAEWQSCKETLKKGYPAYYPYFYADVRRGHYSQGAIKPQFPGYIFVGIEQGHSIEEVRHVNGVKDFLRTAGKLVSISNAQMVRCKKDCRHRFWDSLPRRIERTPVQIGDWVAVPYGAFAGVPAEVLSIDKSGRISASLGNLEVTFHVDDVQKVERVRAKPAEIQLLKAS